MPPCAHAHTHARTHTHTHHTHICIGKVLYMTNLWRGKTFAVFTIVHSTGNCLNPHYNFLFKYKFKYLINRNLIRNSSEEESFGYCHSTLIFCKLFSHSYNILPLVNQQYQCATIKAFPLVTIFLSIP